MSYNLGKNPVHVKYFYPSVRSDWSTDHLDANGSDCGFFLTREEERQLSLKIIEKLEKDNEAWQEVAILWKEKAESHAQKIDKMLTGKIFKVGDRSFALVEVRDENQFAEHCEPGDCHLGLE